MTVLPDAILSLRNDSVRIFPASVVRFIDDNWGELFHEGTRDNLSALWDDVLQHLTKTVYWVPGSPEMLAGEDHLMDVFFSLASSTHCRPIASCFLTQLAKHNSPCSATWYCTLAYNTKRELSKQYTSRVETTNNPETKSVMSMFENSIIQTQLLIVYQGVSAGEIPKPFCMRIATIDT